MKRIAGLIFPVILSVLISCSKMKEKNMYGFTVQNWKAKLAGFPIEDSYAYNETRRLACVADGVTRDFMDGTVAGRNAESLIKLKKGLYPNYAKDASKIFVDDFMDYQSFDLANRVLGDYNIETGLVPTDYLAKDFAGCVAAGIFEDDEKIKWEYIADSGIAIIDKKGNLKFKTKDEGPHSFEKNPHLEAVLRECGGFSNPEGRKMIRSEYRNNPNEPFAYGVLTGEPAALHYVREGVAETDPGNYILIFTDGIREIIFLKDEQGKEKIEIRKEYLEKILENDFKSLEKLCKKNISTEGTLVVWKVE